MESSTLMIWLKSLCNVIVGSDNENNNNNKLVNYFMLPSSGSKTIAEEDEEDEEHSNISTANKQETSNRSNNLNNNNSKTMTDNNNITTTIARLVPSLEDGKNFDQNNNNNNNNHNNNSISSSNNNNKCDDDKLHFRSVSTRPDSTAATTDNNNPKMLMKNCINNTNNNNNIHNNNSNNNYYYYNANKDTEKLLANSIANEPVENGWPKIPVATVANGPISGVSDQSEAINMMAATNVAISEPSCDQNRKLSQLLQSLQSPPSPPPLLHDTSQAENEIETSKSDPRICDNNGHALNGNCNRDRDPQPQSRIASSKLIDKIIDDLRERQVFAHLDPFTSDRHHRLRLSPLVNVDVHHCTISGLSHIEKAKTNGDGLIRRLDANRFAIDCVLRICDVRLDARCRMKIGHSRRLHWRRVCLRDKSFSLRIDACVVYVEMRINLHTRSIRFERFSPISQQNVRVDARPFRVAPLDSIFRKLLQRYFEQHFAANSLKLEMVIRRFLDRDSSRWFDDIVTNTALSRCLQCFPSASNQTIRNNLSNSKLV